MRLRTSIVILFFLLNFLNSTKLLSVQPMKNVIGVVLPHQATRRCTTLHAGVTRRWFGSSSTPEPTSRNTMRTVTHHWWRRPPRDTSPSLRYSWWQAPESTRTRTSSRRARWHSPATKVLYLYFVPFYKFYLVNFLETHMYFYWWISNVLKSFDSLFSLSLRHVGWEVAARFFDWWKTLLRCFLCLQTVLSWCLCWSNQAVSSAAFAKSIIT